MIEKFIKGNNSPKVMYTRPFPRQDLVRALCKTADGQIYYGLREVDFSRIYPQLDLTELIPLAGAVWLAKKEHSERLFREVQPATSLYQIITYLGRQAFHNFFGRGFPNCHAWMKCQESYLAQDDPRLVSAKEQGNPFEHKDLEARLARVRPEEVQRFKKQLLHPPKDYIFEEDYYRLKSHQLPTENIEVLYFQTASPGKSTGRRFSTEVAHTIRGFPKWYLPLEQDVSSTVKPANQSTAEPITQPAANPTRSRLLL